MLSSADLAAIFARVGNFSLFAFSYAGKPLFQCNDDAVKNLGPCVYDTDDNQIILQTAIIDEEGYCHDNHGTY